MGFLEVCVEMFRLSGEGEYTSPGLFAWGLYLVAMVFLALTITKPKKGNPIR